MSEIHPAVDVDVINAKKREQQRAEARRIAKQKIKHEYQERVIKRAKETLHPILWRVGIATTVIILLGILNAFDVVSRSFADFGTSVTLFWLAICLGAGVQYILCERGYMK